MSCEKNPDPRPRVGNRLLGLDFGKYLLSSDKRRGGMETEGATGTDSELSDWEFNQQLYGQQSVSENSEESDEFGVYSSDGGQMFDTVIDSGDRRRFETRRYPDQLDRQSNQQVHSIITQLNNSNNDSAYGGSGLLYPIHESGSQISESSGEDNSDGTLSDSSSPVHNPVYGRYQTFHNQPASSNTDQSDDDLDSLMLHRLPGENLGMILGIEGGKDSSGKVTSVTVKSVTLGGAAYRATGGSKGLCVGDEILQVNNTDLRTLNHDECISVFKDMPLRVLLGVKRGQKDLPPVSISPLPFARQNPHSPMDATGARPVQIARRRDISDSEEEGSAGFAVYDVTVEKEPEENLGLSIVPSYGSTKEYYQIKRILPSGAAAQSGLLHVGDRLISCNGTSLKGLTQHRCLGIIKAASTQGTVDFQVIRPVYDGSPMEISVTLNNNSTRLPSYDPQQFSLKSQSYDRSSVDVVVTSESDEYLTVSEDEYSRKRLADIPEVEANEVFATNSVKLAFSKPCNTIDEDITETEEEDIPVTNVSEVEDTEIVDLNRIDTSPYHIPKRVEKDNRLDLNSVPRTDIDSITSSSDTKYSRQYIPRSDIDSASLTSVSSLSPRSPVPSSDLDTLNTNYSYSRRQQVPKESDEKGLSPPYSPRYSYPPEGDSQDIPASDIDSVKYNPIYEDSNISDFTDSEQAPDIYIASPSFGKQKQTIPYSDLDKISVSSNRSLPHTEIDRVSVGSNSGSEGSEETDSDSVQSSEEEEAPLPPPAEFSDTIDNKEPINGTENKDIYLPYTNLDDIAQESDSTIDISPTHHETEVVDRERKTHHHINFEPSFRDLERASDDQQYELHELDDDSELAFSAELAAPFDSVLQDPSLCVQSPNVPLEYSDTVDNEILQVVQSYDDGTIVISQFDSQDKRERNDSLSHFHPSRHYLNNTMDNNSEAMLKDALDMEYEQLPDSSKLEKRVNLGVSYAADEQDFEDPNYRNDNIVAENIAADIIRNEQGENGYYLESDDEPDQYPDQDAPGDVPDLPDEPPPILNAMPGFDQLVDINNSVKTDLKISNTPPKRDMDRVNVDSNWSFKTNVHVDNDKSSSADGNKDNEEVEIVPMKIERKSELPPKLLNEKVEEEDDIIVPVQTERQQSIPSHFTPVEKQVTTVILDERSPDAPKPVPRKNIVNITVSDPYVDQEPVKEEAIKPSDRNRDLSKNIVNVISVVNALKAASKDKDPDEVDKIVKETVKDKLQNKVSTLIGVDGNKAVETTPPKQEQVVSQKDEISISVKRSVEPASAKQDTQEVIERSYQTSIEVSPPKHDVIEEKKASVVRKPASKIALDISSPPKGDLKNDIADVVNNTSYKVNEVDKPESNQVDKVDTMKTSIFVDNKDVVKETVKVPAETVKAPPETVKAAPKQETVKAPTETLKAVPETVKAAPKPETVKAAPKPAERKQPSKPTVPPPTLPKPTRETKEISVPPSDSPTDKVPPLAYKTTIGVTNKPDATTEKRSLQPTPQIKPLSHIKPLSFNPKSLSQAKPVQYKTTINTVGTKSLSGMSTLGKSSLLNPQKAQHPIKRMETLPFEVSILKGILGIGIKTTMTPEGLVQVSEILPNGPVGREGNIQVGDYLLSINNTALTGLPDSKVQQIMRLLPRGLSKIVASAVPPGGSTSQGAVEDKPLASPTQATLAPVHSTSISVAAKPTTLSTKPVAAFRSSNNADTSRKLSPSSPKSISPLISPRKMEPVQLSPRSPKSTSPAVSPRNLGSNVSPRQPEASPRSPYTSPIASPRQQESNVSPGQLESSILISTRSPRTSPYTSHVVSTRQEAPEQRSPRHQEPEQNSPRQQEPEQRSPRAPPAVAPKPKRPAQTVVEPKVEPVKSEKIEASPSSVIREKMMDPNEPIETEVFASINGSKAEHVPSGHTGPNILPGSMNYDSIQTSDKTAWTQGVVSSTDIKSGDVTIGLSGKTDVVSDTNSQSNLDVSLTLDTPNIETDTMKSETDTVAETDTVQETSSNAAIVKEAINETFEKLSEVKAESACDVNVVTKRPRTYSASSESSSYTEFTECNVEDDIIPKQIQEEEEAVSVHINASIQSVQEQDQNESKSEDYESDFDDDEECDKKETVSSNENNVALRALAENIVSEVIASVKEMNIETTASTDSGIEDQNSSSSPPPLPDDEPPKFDDMPTNVQLQSHTSPDKVIPVNVQHEEAPPLPEEAPPLPAEAPPLPSDAPPFLTEDSPSSSAVPSVPTPVVDLTLYPDESDTEVKEHTIQNETTSASFTTPMHASAPNVDIVNSKTVDNDIIDNDFLSKQVIGHSNGLEEDETSTEGHRTQAMEDKDGDKNISDVISMYADIEQRTDAELNIGVNDNVHSETNAIVYSESNVKESASINNDKFQIEIQSDNKEDTKVHEETESCDTKSLTSSADILSDANVVDNSAGKVNVKPEVLNLNLEINQTDKKTTDETISSKLNGHDKNVRAVPTTDNSDEKTDSLSPRSDTKRSPRSVDAFLSDLESPKQKYSPELDKMIRMMSASDEPKHDGEGDIIHVTLNRGVTGIGFLIQGGKGSPLGDRPITVKRIFKGGPAEGHLEEDDEILEVAGEDISNMRQLEARTHLKFLPSGDVDLTIRRYTKRDATEEDVF